jgi:hypothetical protein
MLTDVPRIFSSTLLPGILDRPSPYWQLFAGVKLLCKLANNPSSGTSQHGREVNKQQPSSQGYQYSAKHCSADNKVNNSG